MFLVLGKVLLLKLWGYKTFRFGIRNNYGFQMNFENKQVLRKLVWGLQTKHFRLRFSLFLKYFPQVLQADSKQKKTWEVLRRFINV